MASTSNITINDELNHLHQKFISDALSQYDVKLNQENERYLELLQIDDEDTTEIYQSGLKLWALFNVPLLPKNETIFGAFYKKVKTSISFQARQILARWANRVPSVLEVQNVPDEGSYITVIDIESDKSYQIPYHQGKDLAEGSLVIGTLVPLADHHSFIFTIITLFQHNKERIKEIISEYTANGQGFSKDFPKFLADVLVRSMDEVEWSNPLHEQVAQLFADHLVQKNIADNIIFNGVSLWKAYCDQENPTLKNVESYAASLEYLVQKNLIGNNDVTQGQLAEEYNTSAGTISTNYRKLASIIEQE
jgi:uncharacterized protein